MNDSASVVTLRHTSIYAGIIEKKMVRLYLKQGRVPKVKELEGVFWTGKNRLSTDN